MKILVVITTAFTSTGGLTTVMMNYYRAMNKEGLKIDFASTNVPSQSLLDEIHVEGSEYYQLPPRKKIVSYFYRLRRLCKNYDLYMYMVIVLRLCWNLWQRTGQV